MHIISESFGAFINVPAAHPLTGIQVWGRWRANILPGCSFILLDGPGIGDLEILGM